MLSRSERMSASVTLRCVGALDRSGEVVGAETVGEGRTTAAASGAASRVLADAVGTFLCHPISEKTNASITARTNRAGTPRRSARGLMFCRSTDGTGDL